MCNPAIALLAANIAELDSAKTLSDTTVQPKTASGNSEPITVSMAGGRVQIRPLEKQFAVYLDGHLLGTTKADCDARFHGYAIERSLEL